MLCADSSLRDLNKGHLCSFMKKYETYLAIPSFWHTKTALIIAVKRIFGVGAPKSAYLWHSIPVKR